jgi:hypothetical protein
MLIQKVKVNKNKSVSIAYREFIKDDEETGEIWNAISLTTDDYPGQGFYKALGSLTPHVSAICEFSLGGEDIKVKGVEFTHTGEDNILGARILAEKVLHNSDINLELKTPHKIESPYNDADTDDKSFSKDCVKILNKLIEETEKYIAGERDQLSLDLK